MQFSAPRRLGWLAAGLGSVALLAACEYPSEAPSWQTQWQVPAESASLSVRSFLPSGVTVSTGGSTFDITVPSPAPVNTNLLAVCGASCSTPATVAVPAFNNNSTPISGTVALPAGASSITVVSGAIDIRLTNNFGFDPIRPAGSVTSGSLRIRLTAGGGAFTVVDTTFGAGTLIPVGVTSTFRVAVRPGTIPAGNLAYAVTMVCPGSATPATIAPTQSFSVQVQGVSNGLQLSKATVTLVGQAVSDSSPAIDLTNTKLSPSALQSVGAVLRISNPFQVSGTFNLALTAPGVAPVIKTLVVPTAPNDSTPVTSTTTVAFTGAEFQTFLGRSGVRLRYSGSVTGAGAGNTVGVRPNHVMGIQGSLLAGVLIGNVP